ncbi:hypothetical protein [Magnetospirillum sp. 15-1]|uniref:hypothetical protein n=1 Tax=Magnetospirillum sp. 15-1 TaxID=1979370 RepID=UPI0011448657|nr:hypothetical protein [Magnetospirillum sp. 15-1]
MGLSVSLLLCLSVGLGLGAWWHIPSPGTRLMLGIMTIPAVLLVGNMALGLGLRVLAWGLLVPTLAGLAHRRPGADLWRLRPCCCP